MPADIGSDFELVDPRWLVDGDNMPPWLRGCKPSNAQYFESGRQALAAAAIQLGADGRRVLLLPDHFCDSMVEPFISLDWKIGLLPVGDDLQLQPGFIGSSVRKPTETVILHAPYFGRQGSAEVIDELRDAEAAGVAVVVDETHSWFSGPSVLGQLRIASLRKMLPLADGAYLIGSPLVTDVGPTSGAASLRREAMSKKSQFLRGETAARQHLELFRKAESVTEACSEPRRMSEYSRRLIRKLDYAGISARRRKNARAFFSTLSDRSSFRPITTSFERNDWTPSHVVLSGVNVSGLRKALINQRIYCPIHWPPSRLLQPTHPWPSKYISMPVDHRYDPEDMKRMAMAVNEFTAASTDDQTAAGSDAE